jgi:hypothetical protein
MLRPIVRWLSEGYEFQFGAFTDGSCFISFTDGVGNEFTNERTPDQMRESAWKMIGMADAAEEVVA